MQRHSRTFAVIILIIILMIAFSQCVHETTAFTDGRGKEYAGASKCISCHKNIYESYINSAHFITTTPASKETVKGSFNPDSNTYYYRPELKVSMENRDTGLYQVAYLNGTERKAARFDIVFGSGRKGQSFVYWYKDHILQLPVSYYVPEKSWVNSPNYPPHNVKFDRNVTIGCFECHASYINKTSETVANEEPVDHFDRDNIIYGIDCERCHGPAATHVDFHEKNPEEKKAAFIAGSKNLSRDGKTAMCAVCHSGSTQTMQVPFNYKPGDKLSTYIYPSREPINNADAEVHGKQYQLLYASKCFIKSPLLNCSSCHNPHIKERDDPALFSRKCMNCHNTTGHKFCSMTSLVGPSIINNCIDCHMPAKSSKIITVKSQINTTAIPALVRTHFISIYPAESERFLSRKK